MASVYSMVERTSTGIPGLDELIEGGVPKDSVTMVTGNTGSGKTTFCTQFLINGMENGEKCLYITTEELPEMISEDAQSFGWDLDAYAKQDKFRITYIDPSKRSNYLHEDIQKLVEEVDPDRIVLDSISVIGAYWYNDEEMRTNMHALVKGMRNVDATVVMTAEMAKEDSGQLTRYGITEYIVDGVIALGGLSLGQSTFRSLQVIKMRRTDIEEDVQGLDITKEGLVVEDQDTF